MLKIQSFLGPLAVSLTLLGVYGACQAATLSPIVQMVTEIERAWCLAKNATGESYHPRCNVDVTFDKEKEKALDLEFKIYPSGQFLIKQVREFRGR